MENFNITYDTYNREQLNYRESILTLGNTYMGIRGVEDELPDHSMPGFYIAGLFNKSECLIPEIVNFPSFMPMYMLIDGEKLCADTADLLDYCRQLNMKDGAVERSITYKSKKGKSVTIESKRFLSFYDRNCGAICFKVRSNNFSGSVELNTEYDGSLLSREGSYLYEEKVKHYSTVSMNDQFEEDFYTRLRLRDTGYLVDIASYTGCTESLLQGKSRKLFGERVIESFKFEISQNQEITFYKYFAVVDSRDIKESSLKEVCFTKLNRMKANGFKDELKRSVEILASKWDKSNVVIEGDAESDRALRFNIYNLIALGSEDTSRFAIGAKGLSTEHYGGHYFWDTEAYLIPFYVNTAPAVARNLLKFRYNNLEKAKLRAREQGFCGCLWPWQSTDDGEEGIRQTVKENGVVVRRHILDQYHIVSDVAFACFKYYYRTKDEYFFRTCLSTLVVEAMRFWKSFIYKCNAATAKEFHLRQVMGPDEYHTSLDDNFYTNYMTKFIFKAFFEYYYEADEKQQFDIREKNKITLDELLELKLIGEKIYLPDTVDGVIEQFAGYFKLRDLIIDKFTEKGLPIYPDPQVGLGLPDAERQDALQQDATTTQLIKQADVLMAICQNPSDFDYSTQKKSFLYYLKRTLQYSSLSPGTYALAAAMAGEIEEGHKLFKLAVNMDLQDIKNETETGLHTACHGGAYLSVVEGFAGVRGEKDYLNVEPALPKGWKSIKFKLNYNGMLLDIKVEPSMVSISSEDIGCINIRFNSKVERVNLTGTKIVIRGC